MTAADVVLTLCADERGKVQRMEAESPDRARRERRDAAQQGRVSWLDEPKVTVECSLLEAAIPPATVMVAMKHLAELHLLDPPDEWGPDDHARAEIAAEVLAAYLIEGP